MMNYFIENGNVYKRIETESGGSLTAYVGPIEKVETIRIDDETVADVTYQFDEESGQYVEQSRTERAEPLPPPPPSLEDRIVQLEDESAMLALELVDTQIRLEQSENEQAALILELVEKGVI